MLFRECQANMLNPADLTEQFHRTRNVACGLDYLHDLGIVHEDMKLYNVGVNQDRRGT